MSSPRKKLKKSNDKEEHRNKTANEKWVEGYNYFLSQEGQEEHQRKMKNGRHVLGNTEKRLVIILMHQFQIL